MGIRTWDSVVTNYQKLTASKTNQEKVIPAFGPKNPALGQQNANGQWAISQGQPMRPPSPIIGNNQQPTGNSVEQEMPQGLQPPANTEPVQQNSPPVPPPQVGPRGRSAMPLPPNVFQGKGTQAHTPPNTSGSQQKPQQIRHTTPPEQDCSKNTSARQQELALRTLFGLMRQGVIDQTTWDVLRPLREMIIGDRECERHEKDC